MHISASDYDYQYLRLFYPPIEGHIQHNDLPTMSMLQPHKTPRVFQFEGLG